MRGSRRHTGVGHPELFEKNASRALQTFRLPGAASGSCFAGRGRAPSGGRQMSRRKSLACIRCSAIWRSRSLSSAAFRYSLDITNGRAIAMNNEKKMAISRAGVMAVSHGQYMPRRVSNAGRRPVGKGAFEVTGPDGAGLRPGVLATDAPYRGSKGPTDVATLIHHRVSGQDDSPGSVWVARRLRFEIAPAGLTGLLPCSR